MTGCPLDTPAFDDPFAAGLAFVAGAVVGLGSTVLIGHAMKDLLQRKDDKGMER